MPPRNHTYHMKNDDECESTVSIMLIVILVLLGMYAISIPSEPKEKCKSSCDNSTICSVDTRWVKKYPLSDIDIEELIFVISPERDFEGNITDKKYFVDGNNHRRYWNGIPLRWNGYPSRFDGLPITGNYTCYYHNATIPGGYCGCL